MLSINRQKAFTLVEIITVIVILAIVSSIGASVMTKTMNAYRDGHIHNQLIQHGRLAIEQVSRQLRMALPGSIRVSSSGNCLEFLPIVAGAYYLTDVPDEVNGKADVASIATSPFTLGYGDARHVVVAPFNANEIYTSAKPAARVGVGSLSGTVHSAIPLANSHQFLRNSNQQRIYVTDNPKRVCLSTSDLYLYEDYGLLTGGLTDGDPGGQSILIAQQVSTASALFSISPGSEDRNTAVYLNMVFSSSGRSVDLTHQVLIKNVP